MKLIQSRDYRGFQVDISEDYSGLIGECKILAFRVKRSIFSLIMEKFTKRVDEVLREGVFNQLNSGVLCSWDDKTLYYKNQVMTLELREQGDYRAKIDTEPSATYFGSIERLEQRLVEYVEGLSKKEELEDVEPVDYATIMYNGYSIKVQKVSSEKYVGKTRVNESRVLQATGKSLKDVEYCSILMIDRYVNYNLRGKSQPLSFSKTEMDILKETDSKDKKIEELEEENKVLQEKLDNIKAAI